MFSHAVGSYKKVKASREALAQELQVTLGTDSSCIFAYLLLSAAYLPLAPSGRARPE